MAIELATRRRFVAEITRLKLWYVRRLLARAEIEEADLPIALTQRVNLYRMTTLFDDVEKPRGAGSNPEWQRVAASLAELVLASPAEDTSDLEERGLALLLPYFEGRLERDCEPPPAGPFVCWHYRTVWAGIADAPEADWRGKLANWPHVREKLHKAVGLAPPPPRHCAVHFENVLQPASPFEDMPALAGTLAELIADCRRRHPSVRWMWSNSWLNGNPFFLSLFPPEWKQSRRPAHPPGYSNSWWGPFATNEGDFNDAVAGRFRKCDGAKFPFPPLLCHAELDAIDAKLSKIVAA